MLIGKLKRGELGDELNKMLDDLLGLSKKYGDELTTSIKNVRKGRKHKGGDLTKSFFDNAGIKTQKYTSEFSIFGQTKDYTCVANSLRMVLDDKAIFRSEDFLSTALKTDKNGARILDIPDALYNNYLDDVAVQAEKKIPLESLITKMDEGDKAIVSVSTKEMGKHALVIDKIEDGKVFVRDPLPKNGGSSYTIELEDFEELFKESAVIIKN